MESAVERIWNDVCPVLKEELSVASYKSFLEDLSPVCINDRLFVLETQDVFVRKTLEERYSETVENALYRTSGRRFSVRFILPTDKGLYVGSEVSDDCIKLNSKYTFDSFVIGSSNKFAHAAAMAIAKNPGTSYNPLFIYGDVGLGKTHLMHAIGNSLKNDNPSFNIMYVTSEKFTNELISAIRNDKNEAFRKKFRNVDVLMIDDIQFISNKEGTQEEFFHTFNALYDDHRQIVISSDKPPKDIPKLEERLVSRFGWGLIADIQRPDLETRVAILQKKAISERLHVSEEVLHFIATLVESNIRELEGSLTKVVAMSDLTGEPITIVSASEALKDLLHTGERHEIDIPYIQTVVAKQFKLTVGDFVGKKRNREVVFPRQIAMYLCREMTDASLPKIGEAFGGRDHSTVIHSIDKVAADMKTDMSVKKTVDDLVRRIKE